MVYPLIVTLDGEWCGSGDWMPDYTPPKRFENTLTVEWMQDDYHDHWRDKLTIHSFYFRTPKTCRE